MPILLPWDLPARRILEDEGIALLDAVDTQRWGMPPLRVALLNLMPQKAITETQFARLLGASPVPVELTLFVPSSYTPKTTPVRHLERFYTPWREVRERSFDGLIVTGAPVETLPYESVTYFDELERIFAWARHRVQRTLYVCWAAQAALYARYGIPKHALAEKSFGVFKHRVLRPDAPVLRGFGDEFWTPVSRHTEIRSADLPRGQGLRALAYSPQSGLCLLEGSGGRALYMFDHIEYDTDTLKAEHVRDLKAGKPIATPRSYYAGDDPCKPPINRWRPFAHLFFSNWTGELLRDRLATVAKAA